ncbi:hypothetical protein HU200_014686 [Digitaria exilis]|uniref:Cupin type-1 domain-containing protein n=1 Tax=Digitaria exilis TaxID=1010633 RepID=A0A835FBI3_9POAL|nr:hypothetical protein HU200_014686 [Digitaria exilis]
MVVSFNSQNPGIIFVPQTLFGSSPPIATPVLVKALRVDAEVVELLKSKFTSGSAAPMHDGGFADLSVGIW